MEQRFVLVGIAHLGKMRGCFIFWLYLFMHLAVLVTSDVEPWAGSQLGTTNYNKEMEVIELAKHDYAHAVNQSQVYPRKELLCVCFSGLNPNSTLVLHRNVGYAGRNCDWAVLLYAGTPGEIRSICNIANSTYGNVALCMRSKESVIAEKMRKSIPKSVQYQSLLPILPLYNRVLMMDEDISLRDLNFTAFLSIWDCAFPKYRPLVVQPLIAENNQYIPYVNEAPWRAPAYKGVLASSVGYVEQQVPAMDAIFFEWYVKRVLIQAKEIAMQYAMDWGHDRSWCNAAALYAQEVLRWPLIGFNHTVPPPCALITSTQTIAHHLNHHTMQIVRGRLKTVRRHAFIVVQRYIDLYPTWVGLDLVNATSPFNETNTERYQQVRLLDGQCLRDRQHRIDQQRLQQERERQRQRGLI